MIMEDDPQVVDHREGIAQEGETVTRHPDAYSLARGWMRTFTMMIAFLWLLVETALAFRLAFMLGGANPGNGFVNFIYDVSRPFVAPFEGIFSESRSGSSVFEPETVIAMAVWTIAAIIFVALVNVLTSAPAPVERESVSRERYAHMDRRY
jgi:hypothetical protein